MDKSPVAKANAYASEAERYGAQNEWSKAMECHFLAAEQFLQAISTTKDSGTIRTLKLLYSNHSRRAKELQRRIQLQERSQPSTSSSQSSSVSVSSQQDGKVLSQQSNTHIVEGNSYTQSSHQGNRINKAFQRQVASSHVNSPFYSQSSKQIPAYTQAASVSKQSENLFVGQQLINSLQSSQSLSFVHTMQQPQSALPSDTSTPATLHPISLDSSTSAAPTLHQSSHHLTHRYSEPTLRLYRPNINQSVIDQSYLFLDGYSYYGHLTGDNKENDDNSFKKFWDVVDNIVHKISGNNSPAGLPPHVSSTNHAIPNTKQETLYSNSHINPQTRSQSTLNLTHSRRLPPPSTANNSSPLQAARPTNRRSAAPMTPYASMTQTAILNDSYFLVPNQINSILNDSVASIASNVHPPFMNSKKPSEMTSTTTTKPLQKETTPPGSQIRSGSQFSCNEEIADSQALFNENARLRNLILILMGKLSKYEPLEQLQLTDEDRDIISSGTSRQDCGDNVKAGNSDMKVGSNELKLEIESLRKQLEQEREINQKYRVRWEKLKDSVKQKKKNKQAVEGEDDAEKQSGTSQRQSSTPPNVTPPKSKNPLMDSSPPSVSNSSSASATQKTMSLSISPTSITPGSPLSPLSPSTISPLTIHRTGSARNRAGSGTSQPLFSNWSRVGDQSGRQRNQTVPQRSPESQARSQSQPSVVTESAQSMNLSSSVSNIMTNNASVTSPMHSPPNVEASMISTATTQSQMFYSVASNGDPESVIIGSAGQGKLSGF